VCGSAYTGIICMHTDKPRPWPRFFVRARHQEVRNFFFKVGPPPLLHIPVQTIVVFTVIRAFCGRRLAMIITIIFIIRTYLYAPAHLAGLCPITAAVQGRWGGGIFANHYDCDHVILRNCGGGARRLRGTLTRDTRSAAFCRWAFRYFTFNRYYLGGTLCGYYYDNNIQYIPTNTLLLNIGKSTLSTRQQIRVDLERFFSRNRRRKLLRGPTTKYVCLTYIWADRSTPNCVTDIFK